MRSPEWSHIYNSKDINNSSAKFWQIPTEISEKIKNQLKPLEKGFVSPQLGGKRQVIKYSPLRLAWRKSRNKLRQVDQRILNFGKSNFINPYPNAQLNTIDLFLNKWIETDYEKAKKTGGLIIPKIFRTWAPSSYLGKWLDTTLMPTGIPQLAWKTRQKLNKILIPRLRWGTNKIKSIYRKTEELILPIEKVKERRRKRYLNRLKFRENIQIPVEKLQKYVNKEIEIPPLSLFPQKKRKSKLPSWRDRKRKWREAELKKKLYEVPEDTEEVSWAA